MHRTPTRPPTHTPTHPPGHPLAHPLRPGTDAHREAARAQQWAPVLELRQVYHGGWRRLRLFQISGRGAAGAGGCCWGRRLWGCRRCWWRWHCCCLCSCGCGSCCGRRAAGGASLTHPPPSPSPVLFALCTFALPTYCSCFLCAASLPAETLTCPHCGVLKDSQLKHEIIIQLAEERQERRAHGSALPARSGDPTAAEGPLRPAFLPARLPGWMHVTAWQHRR